MMKLATKLFAAILIAAVAPASAQDSTEPVSATLRVEEGSAMTSTGGDFVTANTGQVVVEGERLMVPENSTVTVVYRDDCERLYDTPGVYNIEPDCDRAVVSRTGGTHWRGAAIIGAIAVGAVVLASDSNNDASPPVSR